MPWAEMPRAEMPQAEMPLAEMITSFTSEKRFSAFSKTSYPKEDSCQWSLNDLL